tara:strand:- start:14210 stop:15013 length:804 start_codon:yes stop_codon:yes gene_type:complete
MKLGISYNIFDGEEMLPFSINNLRPFAHHISVVYQTTSNYGNACNPKLVEKLEMLLGYGLIDKLFLFEPEIRYEKNGKDISWKSGMYNEQQKREIGLKISRANDCDAFLSLDCDELYDPKEFKFAMDEFEKGGFDTSFTKILTYYKLPTMQLDPPEEYYAPLFYKIKTNTKYEFLDDYPVKIDRTRMVKAGHTRVFTRKEIQMYHYAYVRHNLKSKVKNSSAQSDVATGDLFISFFDKWNKAEDNAQLIDGRRYGLIQVENKFKIKI